MRTKREKKNFNPEDSPILLVVEEILDTTNKEQKKFLLQFLKDMSSNLKSPIWKEKGKSGKR